MAKFDTVVFLDKPLNDINRAARIERRVDGRYHIVNYNMPYQGTLNEIWTHYKLHYLLRLNKIELK
jgi:hypothetical protein